MLSGIVNSDNLSQALRDISQRRRQGVFEVTLPQRRLDVVFVQGRVVDVLEAGQRPVDEICAILKRSGYVAQDFVFTGEVTAYADLFLALQSNPGRWALDDDLFKLAIKHRILELLYSLWTLQDGTFMFHSRMAEAQRDFLPSISVGQLLLDVVALDEAREKYSSRAVEGIVFEAAPIAGKGMSPEEKFTYEIIGKGCCTGDLEQRSFLSAYHLQESFISLLGRGLVVSRIAGVAPDRHGDVDALFAALEKSVDSAFEPFPDDVETQASAQAEASTRAPRARAAVPVAQAEEPLAAGIADGDLPRARSSLLSLNASLLQSAFVPNLLVVLLIAAAVLAPFLFWFEGLMKLADLNP